MGEAVYRMMYFVINAVMQQGSIKSLNSNFSLFLIQIYLFVLFCF